MNESGDSAGARRAASRWRDIWQLHVPLVIVLLLCATMTVIEVRRAADGVWRAWAYMLEWPLIGVFSIWIWQRYRTRGSLFAAWARRWRERLEELGREADATARETSSRPVPQERRDADAGQPDARAPVDPELAAWRDYQRRLGQGPE